MNNDPANLLIAALLTVLIATACVAVGQWNYAESRNWRWGLVTALGFAVMFGFYAYLFVWWRI